MDEYVVLRESAAEGAPVVGAVEWRGGAVRAYGDPEFTAMVVRRVRERQFRRHLETGTPLRSGFGRQEYDNFRFLDEGDPVFERAVRSLLDDGGEVEVVPAAAVGDGWVNPEIAKRTRERARALSEEVARREAELDAADDEGERVDLADLLEVAKLKLAKVSAQLEDSESRPK